MPCRLWMELSTADLRDEALSSAIAILPVAAVEQHGPHLPLGTDAYIMQGYLDRCLPLVPDELSIVVLPTQTIGLSTEHLSFPGTLTLPANNLIKAWTAIGDSLVRTGCSKLVIVNSHGGNSPVLDIAGRDLRLRHGLLVVTTSWHRLGYPAGLFDEEELRHGIHGGEIETSLMLAFRPDLVRMDVAQDFRSRTIGMAADFTYLRADRPAGFSWLSEDLHPSGAIGNAAAATVEKGEAAAHHGAEAFAALLKEVARFEL